MNEDIKSMITVIAFFFIVSSLVGISIIFGCYMTQSGCDAPVALPVWCR